MAWGQVEITEVCSQVIKELSREQGDKKALFEIREDGETPDGIRITNIETRERGRISFVTCRLL